METRELNIIFTTDIHGNYFPFDFRHDRWGKGSLQRVHGYVAQQVRKCAGPTLLIDGGDLLQGEPASYYLNYVSQGTRHKVADMCNFIGYDVAVVGNHDIETGHDVFDRFVNDCNFPVLGANAVDSESGQPYFEPYAVFTRCGVRVAVIGFITPAIPHWVPERVWSGMAFEDVRESARHWIAEVREKERPDFIVGLFHSGMDGGIVTPDYHENAVRETVSQVDGFDLVLYGHDHAAHMEEVESPSGRGVICVNPGSCAVSVAEVHIKFALADGQVVRHDIDAGLRYIGTVNNTHALEFKRHFKADYAAIKRFATRRIGHMASTIDICDAYFGSSAYIDFIQTLQREVTGADVSFAAPLFFSAVIEAGDVRVSDLFNLYRFEDRLYTLRLTGREIKDYLEMSYANWTARMRSADDPLLQLSPMKSNPERIGFTHFIFNFDSAAGLRYEVDVRREPGGKVTISSMEDGTPFQSDKTYRVAMTAYRANGGGELLTKGAGLTKDEIQRRIEHITEHDVRYYMMQHILSHHTVDPQPHHNWRFVPEQWVRAAEARERQILFGEH